MRAGRLVTGACAACCGPGTARFYLRVCPCFDPNDGGEGILDELVACRTPVEECAYLLVAGGDDPLAWVTTISDRFGVLLKDRLGELLAAAGSETPLVIWFGTYGLDGRVCYRITGGLYCDPSATEAERLAFLDSVGLGQSWMPSDLPDGATVPSLAGYEIARMNACGAGHGCTRWTEGPPYHEAKRCNGLPTSMRLFVCAANNGLSLTGPDGECWCIGRTERFESSFVDGLVAAGEAWALTDTLHMRWWRWDAQAGFYCAPAPCCWCLWWINDTAAGCFVNTLYAHVPDQLSTLWATASVCCGSQAGNRLRVEVEASWSRSFTDDNGHAVTFAQEIVGPPRHIDNPTGNGGTMVEVDVRSVTVVDGATTNDQTNAVQIYLPPACVLFGNPDRQIPWPGTFQPHTQVDGGPGPLNGCAAQGWLEYDGNWDDAEQISFAIATSRWGSVLRQAFGSSGAPVSQSGTFRSDRRTLATVRLSQHIDDGPFGVIDARIVLTVRAIPDLTSPCGPGPCGDGGVDGLPAWELIP